MPYKYSAILIPSIPFFPRFDSRVDLGGNVFLQRGRLSDFLVGEEADHWKSWIGEINWNSLNDEKILLLSYSESENPDVLDEENRNLDDKVFRAFDLLPLVAPYLPPIDQAYSISGKGQIQDAFIKFLDIRSYSRLDIWTKAFYSTNNTSELLDWEAEELSSVDNFNVWRDVLQHFNTIIQNQGNYPYLIESYRSFREAFYSNHLEFKIPNLVRSIESLIALGRSRQTGGWENFVDRTYRLISSMPFVPLISLDETLLKSDLKELYFVRNDCSHGKLITDSLSGMEEYAGGVTSDHIALLEMLAESASRYILRNTILGNSIKPLCHSRIALENGWANGSLP